MRCKIIYEDEELLVIHKPAGLATQSAKVGQSDVVSELKGYLARKTGGGPRKEPYLGVVHRLDQPVEGFLVFAKTQRAAAALTRQLQKGSLNKTYVAAVYGIPKAPQMELTDSLVKDGNAVRVVTGQEKNHPDAKEARLSYRLFRSFRPGELDEKLTGMVESRKTDAEISILEVRLETGRFHQIRAQLSYAGLPILGDQKYGSEASRELSETLGVRNVALCAESLELVHPITKKKMSWRVSPENKIFQNISN